MKELKIKKIFVKFINNEANIVELEILEKWLTNSNNLKVFNKFILVEYLTKCSVQDYNLEEVKFEIYRKIKANRRQKRIRMLKQISFAASIVLVSVFSYIVFNQNQNQKFTNTPVKETNVIKPGTDKAILTLGNGNQVSLTKDETYKNNYLKSNGKKITYDSKDEKTIQNDVIEFNSLTIPRGGEYAIVFSDGSKVWLNSETKLKYPTKFISGKERNVELLYGEAYFEISPSSKHNGSKFNVITKGQKVSVFGTEFNIKAYNDEAVIATTLVGGKIQIEKGNIRKILVPNQQARINRDLNTISIVSIDVSNEIAWVKGLFSFEEARLDEMMKTLSRWYNMDVIFENSSRKKIEFTGILERTKTIQEIINIIKKTSQKNEIIFKIEDKIIKIK
ncbi:FecR family protein [Polaribacter cellanae]|uniref:FecR family protein n=1 Tax=Polaribacter cellanae TaxID=2818493 RepID=A0A975CRQ8_9FLAO|nr:FecR family protein [Polaribacter cellanae]QTE23679.1 FecR family protein [Polaribacter cellanae]